MNRSSGRCEFGDGEPLESGVPGFQEKLRREGGERTDPRVRSPCSPGAGSREGSPAREEYEQRGPEHTRGTVLDQLQDDTGC